MAEVRVELEVAAGRLPEVCARCGEAATTSKWKTMSWYPRWINYLILGGFLLGLIGLLPGAILASIFTKKASAKVPFCEQHKWHWLSRNLLMSGSFVILGVIGVGSILLAQNRVGQTDLFPFVCIGDLVLLVGWLVLVVILQSTAVRPKEITDSEIVIAGVCDEFVDAVEESEREFRGRRLKAKRILEEEDADEEEKPRPRKTRPSTEVQADEPRPRKKKLASDEIEE